MYLIHFRSYLRQCQVFFLVSQCHLRFFLISSSYSLPKSVFFINSFCNVLIVFFAPTKLIKYSSVKTCYYLCRCYSRDIISLPLIFLLWSKVSLHLLQSQFLPFSQILLKLQLLFYDSTCLQDLQPFFLTSFSDSHKSSKSS